MKFYICTSLVLSEHRNKKSIQCIQLRTLISSEQKVLEAFVHNQDSLYDFCRMRQSHRMRHLPIHCLHRLGLMFFPLMWHNTYMLKSYFTLGVFKQFWKILYIIMIAFMIFAEWNRAIEWDVIQWKTWR